MIKTPAPRLRFESMRCCHKRKAPLPEALSSIGAAYRIPRIRCADPHRLRPLAGALARGLKTLRVFLTPAPRLRFESMRCCHKRKAPLPEALSSIGAAYRIPRIRCADPHRLRPLAGALARGLKTLRVFLTPAPRPRFESMRWRHKRKAPVAGGFQFQLVRRIGFEPMTF